MNFLIVLWTVTALLSLPGMHSLDDARRGGYDPALRGNGRRLKLFGGGYGLGGTVKFRSNNQAFSASLAVSPSYLATLVSDDFGDRDGGMAAALAYAVDVRPENWYSYATGADVDDNLLRLLARGPYARTEASLENGDGDAGDGSLSGDAYANARGNLVAFSRAYVHLLEEAERQGVDLKSRSQARAKAVSEKHFDDASVRKLYARFFDEYTSEAKVMAIVEARVSEEEATAKQKAHAETDENPEGNHCARVWLKGEAVEGLELTEEDLLARGLDVDIFEC